MRLPLTIPGVPLPPLLLLLLLALAPRAESQEFEVRLEIDDDLTDLGGRITSWSWTAWSNTTGQFSQEGKTCLGRLRLLR